MEYVLLGSPMHINWNFTYKCNFNCIHCYSRTRTSISELPLQDKLKIAENIIRNDVFNVNLGGGEPLLSEDCLPIIEKMSAQDVRVNLSTNGWKTSTEKVRELKTAGLGGVAVSIDHIDETVHDSGRNMPGSLREVYKSVEKYVDAGIDVVISTTITSRNFDCLEDILDKAVSIGAKGIDLKRLKTMGNAFDRPDLLLNEQQTSLLYENVVKWRKSYPLSINFVYGANRIPNVDAGCPCGKTSLAIMCNGDISPCVYNVQVIGNAITDDLHEIWCHSEDLKYMREHFSCIGLRKEYT